MKSDELFAPFGNFFCIDNGTISVLDSANHSKQVVKLILREPLKTVPVHQILIGHEMKSYFQNLQIVCPIKKNSGRTNILVERFFKPEVKEKASIIWTKHDDKGWKCTLGIKGRGLKTLQLSSKNASKIRRLPFNQSSAIINVYNS